MRYLLVVAFSIIGLLATYIVESKSLFGASLAVDYDGAADNFLVLKNSKMLRLKITTKVNKTISDISTSPAVGLTLLSGDVSKRYVYPRYYKKIGSRDGNIYRNTTLYDEFELSPGRYEVKVFVNNYSKYSDIGISLIESPNILLFKLIYLFWVLVLLFSFVKGYKRNSIENHITSASK